MLCQQVAIYTGGSQLEWRDVEGGQLPNLPSLGLRATLVDGVIFVTGGYHDNTGSELTEVLSWDPLTESWKPAGDLKKWRHHHAAVAITSSILESECSAMP